MPPFDLTHLTNKTHLSAYVQFKMGLVHHHSPLRSMGHTSNHGRYPLSESSIIFLLLFHSLTRSPLCDRAMQNGRADKKTKVNCTAKFRNQYYLFLQYGRKSGATHQKFSHDFMRSAIWMLVG